MKCNECGLDLSEKWVFCPKCGSEVKAGSEKDYLFDELNKEAERICQKIDKDDLLDIKPLFEKSNRASGFSIKITNTRGEKPKIDVKSFGDTHALQKPKKPNSRKIPKKVVDPKTKINRLPTGLVIEIELPGVESAEDIEIHEFKESIEIRAFSKNRMYFKILHIPKNVGLTTKELNNGRLKLAFS
jgi:HSP20 family molecular chaperone IbpA